MSNIPSLRCRRILARKCILIKLSKFPLVQVPFWIQSCQKLGERRKGVLAMEVRLLKRGVKHGGESTRSWVNTDNLWSHGKPMHCRLKYSSLPQLVSGLGFVHTGCKDTSTKQFYIQMLGTPSMSTRSRPYAQAWTLCPNSGVRTWKKRPVPAGMALRTTRV